MWVVHNFDPAEAHLPKPIFIQLTVRIPHISMLLACIMENSVDPDQAS